MVLTADVEDLVSSSSVPHLSISVAEEVSELRIDMRSVLVQTIPVLGGTGGGTRGGISEARLRAGTAGIVVRAKSEYRRGWY
jgi:hypothetical protein